MEVIDKRFLLENIDGDQELLREIVDLFFDSSGAILNELREAVRSADHDALRQAAHRLKGALANLGATAATAAAAELETLGRNGMLTGLEEAWFALNQELERLEPELRSMAAG